VNLHNSNLEVSATGSKNCPPPILPEFVLCGRSNVGKSSLINALVGRKNLARTSSTPGKTRLINFYKIDDKLRFVDLPGYGYAKREKKERYEWQNMIDDYLSNRENIAGFLQLVDSRHKPQELDIMMAGYIKSFIEHRISNNLDVPIWLIVLTKCDKAKKSEYEERLKQAQKELNLGNYANIILFSAVKKQGIDEVWEKIKGSVL